MRDGVQLVADAVMPSAPGRYPAILIRTPYGREPALAAWGAESLARDGYVVVAQDVRGKGDSEGEFDIPWVGEGPDGYDTIEWAAAQSWSNGKIGTLGGSYLGQVQWAAAVLQPPALKTMLVFPAISDPFFGGPYDSGVFSLSPFWAYENNGRRSRDVPDLDEEHFLTLPLSQLDDVMFGESIDLWDRYLTLDTQHSWKGVNWPEDLSGVDVPVMHVMALWDGDGIGPILNWSTMRQYRDDQWLVFGPWGHSMNQRGRRGDVLYGEDSKIDLLNLIRDWFGAWLKDGEFRETRVRVFVTGRNEWRELDDWPPRDAEVVSFYVSPGTESSNLGSLGFEPPQVASEMRFSYDPSKPRRMGFRESVFVDTTELPFPLDANDVLFFQTEPLAEPFAVGAPVELSLSFSTTVEDTDFFALLVDIEESGTVRALTHPGKIRARFLQDWSQPEALTPEKRYSTTIRLWDVAHVFEVGHRVGLVIRSDWFPRWSRNLNTMEAIDTATHSNRAQQTVYCGGEEATVLRVTLLSGE
jgi:hypothetical protein